MSHAEKAETNSPATPARGPVRTALTAALDYLYGAMVKMIPVLLVCGMFKTAQTLIGLAVGGFVGGSVKYLSQMSSDPLCRQDLLAAS